MMLLKKYLFLSEFLCKIKVHDKVSGCIRFYCPDTPGNTVRIIRNTQFSSELNNVDSLKVKAISLIIDIDDVNNLLLIIDKLEKLRNRQDNEEF